MKTEIVKWEDFFAHKVEPEPKLIREKLEASLMVASRCTRHVHFILQFNCRSTSYGNDSHHLCVQSAYPSHASVVVSCCVSQHVGRYSFACGWTTKTRHRYDKVGRRRLYPHAIIAWHDGYAGGSREVDVAMIGLRLTPDRRIGNREVESLATGLHRMYKPFIARLHKQNIEQAPYAVWEWCLAKGKAEATLWVPDDYESVARQHIQTCWPRVTMDSAKSERSADPQHISGADLALREHYFFALGVDRRSLAPLPSLMETLKMLDDELAIVQVILAPVSADWSSGAIEAYEKLKAGVKPQRIRLDAKSIAEGAAKVGAAVALHTSAFVAELITGDEVEPDPVIPPRKLTGERPLSSMTMQKAKYAAFNVTIRVAAISSHKGRREMIRQALETAFRDLDGDNGFVAHRVRNTAKWWRAFQGRMPTIKINPDYLSIPEVARLIQLPTASLQDEYGIAANQHRESDLPDSALSRGILLGTHKYRGQKKEVYMPVEDWDELCLGRVVIACGEAIRPAQKLKSQREGKPQRSRKAQ